jgi:hypothetical protein
MYRPFCRRRGRNSSSLKFAGDEALDLIAKLRNALEHQRPVVSSY